jgi:K+-transporting ATPase A subunit
MKDVLVALLTLVVLVALAVGVASLILNAGNPQQISACNNIPMLFENYQAKITEGPIGSKYCYVGVPTASGKILWIPYNTLMSSGLPSNGTEK